MPTAEILKNGTVILTDNLIVQSKLYDLDGFLVSFTVSPSNKTFIYVNKVTFDEANDAGISNGLLGGYYEKKGFLQFSVKKIVAKDLEQFEPSRYVKLATSQDTVRAQILNIETPYNSLGLKIYKFQKVDPVVDQDFKIIIPPNTPFEPAPLSIVSDVANQFFTVQHTVVNNFDDDSKPTIAELILMITGAIDMIKTQVFDVLFSDQSFNDYIQSQFSEWVNPNLFSTAGEGQIASFYTGLIDFYDVAFKNQLLISGAAVPDKLYWLCLGLSANSMSSIPSDKKIAILKDIAQNRLSSIWEKRPAEELAIRLVLSFNSKNIAEIDPFLEGLINTIPDVNKKNTLLQNLYDRMSTSTNFKAGILTLENWVFKTSYKPTATKAQFIQALYAIWQFSKFCPYNSDGSIKPDTIGFVSTNPDVTFNTDLSNKLFTYTHYVAYTSTPPGEGPYSDYPIIYDKAAPITIPYKSVNIANIFFNDFDFAFAGSKIIASQILPILDKASLNDNAFTNWPTTYGTYDIYQPITLSTYNIDTTQSLSTVKGDDIEVNGENINAFIPIFVLKFIDDDAQRTSAETLLGYMVDVASLFVGIGDLLELRHLRWAATGVETVGLGSVEGFQIVLNGVQFTSTMLSFIGNFKPCSADDNFCNAIFQWARLTQLAFLSLNTIQSLSAGAVALQAKLINSLSAGTDEASMIANIKAKLSQLNPEEDTSLLEDIARAIVRTSVAYSGIPVNTIVAIIKVVAKQLNKIFINTSIFTDEAIADFIRFCRSDVGISDDVVIEDLVLIANRADKPIANIEELKAQARYYQKEILVRGYPAGIASKQNFRLFCTAFKEKFIELLIDLDPEFADLEDSFYFYVKGSAIRAAKEGDPDGAIPKPGNLVDDIDIDILMSESGYKTFCNIMSRYVEENHLSLTNDDFYTKVQNALNPNRDMVMYGSVFQYLKTDDGDFASELREAAQYNGGNTTTPLTNFSLDKINFAIVKKNTILSNGYRKLNSAKSVVGIYDLKPKLPFLY